MNAGDHDRRLEEVAAYSVGALDPGQTEELEAHLRDCGRCQEELHWLVPAVRALPEAVAYQAPPPSLKERLMVEVRTDAAATAKRARREERRGRAASGPGIGERLRGLHVGGLTWRPLAGLAALVLIVAAVGGYAVGSGGGPGDLHTTRSRQPDGIAAEVVTEGGRAEVRLADVRPLAKGEVLEAWVRRAGAVEAVPALFVPDRAGRASTTIENMKDVSVVMVTREPAGGSRAPTTAPIVEVPIGS